MKGTSCYMRNIAQDARIKCDMVENVKSERPEMLVRMQCDRVEYANFSMRE